MRIFRNLSIITGLALGAQTAQAKDLCGSYLDVYQKEISKKIQSGVPFELMTAVFDGKEIVYKKVVHVTYSLWDEIVTLKAGDRVLARFMLTQAPSELCKHLNAQGATELEGGKRYRLRLLLNPMWAQRMVRLHASTTTDLDTKRLVDVNWKKLAQEMPSEKVLLEMEYEP